MNKHAAIPIAAAEEIAKRYYWHQIIIIGRFLGAPGVTGEEHVTTYGLDKANCDVSARIGNFLKYKVMNWEREMTESVASGAAALLEAVNLIGKEDGTDSEIARLIVNAEIPIRALLAFTFQRLGDEQAKPRKRA